MSSVSSSSNPFSICLWPADTAVMRGHLGTLYIFKEVLEGKCNIPGFSGSTMHDDWYFIICCIVLGLLDSCSKIKLFNSLNFKVHSGDANHVRRIWTAMILLAASSIAPPMFSEDVLDFPLTELTLLSLTLPHFDLLFFCICNTWLHKLKSNAHLNWNHIRPTLRRMLLSVHCKDEVYHVYTCS